MTRFILLSGALLASLAVALAPGCRIGPSSSILDEANVQIVIGGLAGGERLTLDLAGEHRVVDEAPEDVLSMFLTLPEGPHDGLLIVEKGAVARCAPFTVDVLAGDELAVVAVAADHAPLCVPADAGPHDGGADDAGIEDGGPNDAGTGDAGPAPVLLVTLAEEVLVVPCITPPCTQTTTVNGDGDVSYVDRAAAPVTGSLDALDLEALTRSALSAEADALFAGADPSCEQVPPLEGLVVLERTRDVDGTVVTDDVDVSLCLTGIAAELRARLGVARAATAP